MQWLRIDLWVFCASQKGYKLSSEEVSLKWDRSKSLLRQKMLSDMTDTNTAAPTDFDMPSIGF